MTNLYYLDANVLITAWHGYYRLQCPTYWEWLAEMANKERIFAQRL